MAGTGGSGSGRSDSEKEKTKMRERQRRAITTKIFHGLRKHGGYRLSPRADINEVLRHLATEAGFLVEPDGTTYRPNVLNCCPVCGGPKASATVVAAAATPSPSSSLVMCGGECSTTASPSRLPTFNSNGGLHHHMEEARSSNHTDHMQEARASNHTTPDASPLHRP